MGMCCCKQKKNIRSSICAYFLCGVWCVCVCVCIIVYRNKKKCMTTVIYGATKTNQETHIPLVCHDIEQAQT